MRFGIGIVGLVLAVALALGARSMRRERPLPAYGHVPTFRLVDQRGAPFSSDAMLGHVGVVDFIFTRCTSSCPRLTARMAEVQSRLGAGDGDVRLVSFSVDPDNDTPPVLEAYAAAAHADPARWSFLTGPADDVTRAVVQGFKVSAAKVSKGAGDYEVVHGDWFVLVDRKGELRGYYPMDEPGEVDALLRDVRRLEREGP